MARTGIGDFDFLVGAWTVANRRLVRRLVGSTDWEEFEGKANCRKILNGMGNIDEIAFPTKGYTGATLRLFDPDLEQWSLYWASTLTGRLEPPVRGRFSDDIGDFYGDDAHNDIPILVHYRWSEITPTGARWEQAFSTDGGSTWERNWVMDFSRIAGG